MNAFAVDAAARPGVAIGMGGVVRIPAGRAAGGLVGELLGQRESAFVVRNDMTAVRKRSREKTVCWVRKLERDRRQAAIEFVRM